MSVTKKKPSRYQVDIIDFALNGSGDAFVDAVAGSGKTTTLEMVAQELNNVNKKALFLAFNKHIASELKGRLQPIGHNVSTIHGVGFLCLKKFLDKKIQIDERKYQEIIKRIVRNLFADVQVEAEDERAICTSVYEVFKFCRSSLVAPTDKEGIKKVISHYDIDTNIDVSLSVVMSVLPYANKIGEEEAQRTGIISYCDMLWLPHVFELVPWQYAYVLVDEAQDLSAAQLELALKCRRKGGRMIFVGDEHQAIYGFAGSDTESVRQIISKTGAKRLPLSVCYRCPKSHIELAKKIVEQIEPSPEAHDGEVKNIKRNELVLNIKVNDLVICRTTSPLVSAAFEIMRSGIPAKIKGRDIGRGLISLVKKMQKNADGSNRQFKIENFLEELRDFEGKMLSSIANADGDDSTQSQRLSDQLLSLKTIFNFSKPRTVELFKQAIEDMFSDGSAAVTLSTVHRAKGLEENRVFILEPDNMPHPMAKSKWERDQEMNIKYVALTRAKKELYMVD